MTEPDRVTVTDARPPWRAPWLRGGVIFAALTAIAFGAVWLAPKGVVLGAPHTDLVGQFIAWRAFAAESLRAGDLPLWNPHTYAGQPFLGGFQSALLYPLNAVFVLLPLDRALNFSVTLHLLILGWGMGHWVRQRGMHPGAAAAAGFTLALSGAVFPHVYAGHLSNLCTMAWAPWAFAGLETWWRDRRPEGLWCAGAAIALQILAGQMQYVFFFGVAAGVHALIATAFEPVARKRALPAVALGCLAAMALAAAQLLPGLEAAAEGVRQGKLDLRFASAFALPPENLLTVLAPGFFGDADLGAHPYWGRGYLWEMSVYFGITGVIFASVALWARGRSQQARRDLMVAALLIVLALGRHLPVYRLLYEYVPGFGQFRGVSKFAFPALIFVLLAVAAGIDGLLRGEWELKPVSRWVLSGAAVLGIAALVLRWQPDLASRLFTWIRAQGNESLLVEPAFPAGAAAAAAASLLRGAVLCVAAGLALIFARDRRWLQWAIVTLLPLEMIAFARAHAATTPVATAMPVELKDFVAAHPGDYRVLNLARPNNGYLLGAPDLWGNDPGVLKRYAEFMTFTQGGDPNAATQNLKFTLVHRLYAMLRCRYAFLPSKTGVNVVDAPNPLPRVLLLQDYRVAAGRDAIFAALADPSFDARHTVMLDREPSPRPQPAAHPGSVRVVSAGNDGMEIDAEVTVPTLLLITDLYSRGWHAHALAGSAQARYEILPANYILRAVPLSAGQHHVRLEYRPRFFTPGLVISLVAWLGWLAAGWFMWRRRMKPAGA